jgi:uncharacterized protein YbaR (Trm112 family)
MPDAPEPSLRHTLERSTLDLLVCPLTKTRLTLSRDRTELISIAGRLAFPIRKGVPMLALDEARDFDPNEIEAIADLKGDNPA